MAVTRTVRIAVIDDDDSFRTATEWLMKAHGFAAAGYASARTFLDEYSEEDVDCIISDINMPGITGLELKQCLNKRSSHIPVIFVSAQTDPSLPARVAEHGGAALLQKPFHGQSLIAAVRLAVGETDED
ncbi:response regulator transcription factor [Rhizobium sp. SL86]|uniref:response regulator transcription factor n=1 Tax=Rhizobium sp. SL86 TaxID=2995148 RepID=UPI00227355AA|nr:response regulator [Rhizobium sp. SL86]MCY1666610.1 response regulator [Rhizobium sp. SL86]